MSTAMALAFPEPTSCTQPTIPDPVFREDRRVASDEHLGVATHGDGVGVAAADFLRPVAVVERVFCEDGGVSTEEHLARDGGRA